METIDIDKRSFQYGSNTIDYSLLFTKRKTLEIAVHPDNSVVVKAPEGSEFSLIEGKIRKRARWIIKQLSYFRQFTPKTPKRCYITGETHLYLGRQYRLKVSHGESDSVKLTRGQFLVTCKSIPTPEKVNTLMDGWYLRKAKAKFNESMERCWPKFKSYSEKKPTISIRHMKKRWGSLTDHGMNLNTSLIKAPKDCIYYVITHELCHLKYSDHGTEFYKLLESVIPDWKKIKHKLELSMV